MQYEELGRARFQTGQDEAGAWLRVPARRNWVVVLFLTVWLCGWVAGGVSAIHDLSRHFEPFLVFWLCGWTVGLLFVGGTILWQMSGHELLRVVGGDLEYRVQLPGYARRRRFRGSEIRNVGATGIPNTPFGKGSNPFPPLFNPNQGSARFDYGARSIYVAPGLDEAEGALIADWLRQRLPGARG